MTKNKTAKLPNIPEQEEMTFEITKGSIAFTNFVLVNRMNRLFKFNPEFIRNIVEEIPAMIGVQDSDVQNFKEALEKEGNSKTPEA